MKNRNIGNAQYYTEAGDPSKYVKITLNQLEGICSHQKSIYINCASLYNMGVNEQ